MYRLQVTPNIVLPPQVLAGKMSYNDLPPGGAHLQRGSAALHDPSLLWKLERLEHEVPGGQYFSCGRSCRLKFIKHTLF